MEAYLMSAGLTPASSKARGPDHTAPLKLKSILPPIWCLGASAAPSIFTGGGFNFFAVSGRAGGSGPPPPPTNHASQRETGSRRHREARAFAPLGAGR